MRFSGVVVVLPDEDLATAIDRYHRADDELTDLSNALGEQGEATSVDEQEEDDDAPIVLTDMVAEFRGRGAMLALEFVTADGEPDSELAHKIAGGAKAEGVLLLTCGLDHNVIRFLPSLAIPEDLWREALQVVVKQFNEYK